LSALTSLSSPIKRRLNHIFVITIFLDYWLCAGEIKKIIITVLLILGKVLEVLQLSDFSSYIATSVIDEHRQKYNALSKTCVKGR